MPLKPDIAIYSPDGVLQVVIEVKAASGTNPEWAAKYRRNLLLHEAIPVSPYFLLLTADQAYLWSGDATPYDAAPKAAVAVHDMLRRFLPKTGGGLSGSSLEMAALSWLRDLALDSSPVHRNDNVKNFLQDSGLLDKIHTGSLALEPSL